MRREKKKEEENEEGGPLINCTLLALNSAGFGFITGSDHQERRRFGASSAGLQKRISSVS